MSTLDSGWILAAGLALFVGWLGWTLLRTRRGPPQRQTPGETCGGAAAPAREAGPAPDPPVPTEGSPEGSTRT